MKLQHIFLVVVACYLTLTTTSVDGNSVISVSGLTFEQLQALLAATGIVLEDTNECENVIPVCPDHAICTNTNGSYQCNCTAGFLQTATDSQERAAECTDIDECDTSSGEADPCAYISGAMCRNTEGSYECLCDDGFEQNTDMTACVDINECLDETTCSSSGPSSCSNTDGSFECNCDSGYSKDADGVCQNIDECAEDSHDCLTNQYCIDDVGSFTCECKPGFQETGVTGEDCVDQNECVDSPCADISGSKCENNEGSYECVCNTEGHENNGTACVDIDECDTMVMGHDCSTNEVCVNTDPLFRCECSPGYSGDPAEDSCTDVDECSAEGTCDEDATCRNIIGGHECFCNIGFFGSGQPETCQNVLSCSTFDSVKSAIDAVRNADSDDDVTSYETTLEQYASASGKAESVPGDTYRAAFDGTMNIHIGNVIDKLRCDYFSSCTESIDSSTTYKCTCLDGYKQYVDPETFETSEIQCTDINECDVETSCGEGAACNNNEGSYTCTCAEGYELTGNISSDCVDINECTRETDNCHADATCDNIDGSFTCTCNAGFFGTGTECQASYTCTVFNNVRNEIDVLRLSTDDETANAQATAFLNQYMNTIGIVSTVPGDTYDELFHPENGSLAAKAVDLLICDYKSECVPKEEGHSCACHDGYTAVSTNPNQCVDIIECDTLSDDACGVTGTCVNQLGSYSCTCNDGYEGGETGHCTDIDECTTGDHECGDTGTCEDLDGTYRCVCHTGYEGGDAAACTNIDECTEGTHNCDSNAFCDDNTGSFQCTCNDGFTGNGTTCDDIDECAASTDTCDSENGECTNTVGSYSCSCKSGFMFSGEGNTCESANSCDAFDKVKQAIDNLRNGDGDQAANEQTLQNYIDAEGKATAVSSASYDLAYPDETNSFITQAIELLRCDYFSSCAMEGSDFVCTCSDGYEGDTDSPNHCTDINECDETDTNNCDTHATCTNKQGGFDCDCNIGYDGNGTVCADINECGNPELNTCDVNATCTNTDGSYECSCKTGFMGTGEKDECTSVLLCSTFDMVKQHIDTIRTATETDDTSAAMTFLQQYADAEGKATGVPGDAYRAVFGDISSAEIANVIDKLRCDYFSSCAEPADDMPDYTCTCDPGYEFITDSTVQCTDIDECQTGDNNCHKDASCTDNEGGFTCACDDGFFGNGTTCSDHDECEGEGGGHDCDSNAECDNVEGGHTCTCMEGYYGDGTIGNCKSVDTCETYGDIKAAIDTVRDGTDADAVEVARKVLQGYAAATGLPARNTGGSYTLEYGSDIDVDIESVINHLICDYHATCDTSENTTTCSCVENFISLGEEFVCFSVQSCNAFSAVKAAITDVNGETDDSPATAAREILQSYAAQTDFATAASTAAYVARYGEPTDMDVKNALDHLRCDFFSTCNFDADAEEAYSCACETGYEQAEQANSCQDTNECETTDHNCDENAACTNSEGSFECACNVGFEGDGVSCNDSTDCTSPEDTKCGSNAICTDTVGSFVCTCVDGYVGDGTVCKATNECLFSGDTISSDVMCADSGRPLSCSFEREFSDIAEQNFQAYSGFFRAPGGLSPSKGETRDLTDFSFSGIAAGICQQSTTYKSPQTAYTDADRTVEVELFSYSCYRQWFIETECTGTPENINLECNTEYLPEKALIIRQDGDKYEVVEEEIYLGSNCKLSFPTMT